MEDDDGSRGEPDAIFGLEEDSKERKRSPLFFLSPPPPHSSASKTRGKKVPMDEKEAVGELGGPDLSGVVVAERISM